jgi:endoglucanase
VHRSPLRKVRRHTGPILAGFATLLLAVAGMLLPATAHAADTSTATPSATAGATPAAEPMQFLAAMQPGWGLSNTFDAIPDPTSWGNPPVTKALIDQVRSDGFHSIRIPVTWGGHEGAAPGYAIDPAFMSQVKQAVDWSLSDGLYVVLDVHHDSWQWITNMAGDPTGVLARFTATWTQIADTFKGESGKLVFESVNEPEFTNATDAQAEALLDQLNTDFCRLVRGTGGGNAHRHLLLPTLGDTPTKPLMDSLLGTIESLHDPDVIASFHYYGYWPFAVNIAGATTFDATAQQDMATDYQLAHDEFIAKGVPVCACEVGLLGYDYTKPGVVERGETLKYFEALGNESRITGIPTDYWDSYINRATLQPRDPDLFAQIQSSWRARSGTASSDMVFLPQASSIAAHSLTLNLNGDTFTSLTQGDVKLARGRDYTVSGDQLTLTASLLTRLAGNGPTGADATLQAHFSHGLPWQISVIVSSQPALAAATGTSSSFAIPTQFNGDVLSTMQARYADGSNAGPANWTSYQEYSTAFAADYANNNTTLTSTFFDSLTDGAKVTLTFHFWSGAAVTYYVTKNGTAVTGSTS